MVLISLFRKNAKHRKELKHTKESEKEKKPLREKGRLLCSSGYTLTILWSLCMVTNGNTSIGTVSYAHLLSHSILPSLGDPL